MGSETQFHAALGGEGRGVPGAQPALPRRLEAEVREAQLRAREETLQGVRVAEELARRELASQKAAYESRIRALEAELVSAPRPRPAWGRRPPLRLPRRTRHAACAVSP